MAKKVKKKGPGRPVTRTHKPDRAAAQRTREGEEKYIILAQTTDIEAMKDLAYWKRLKIKEAYHEAIQDYKEKYERENGKLQPRPQ